MKAEILSIGTELLLGEIVDTNAAWLAEQLPPLGIDLFYISAIGDNQLRLVEALRRGWERSDLIICTGGVGPTEDDRTREAISELLGEPMVVQPEYEKRLREFFHSRGVEMPEKNVKQATLIASGQFLENPVGTAPGWWVQRDNKIIIAMPGVPHEMKQMWENQVFPRLQPLLPGGLLATITLKVLGKGESAVEEMLQDFVMQSNPTVATYAKNDGIHVRIAAKGEDEMTARSLLFETEIKIRSVLGTLIYGQDDETVEDMIGILLQDRSLSLGVMEAGTGGTLTAQFSGAKDSQSFFRGGLISSQPMILSSWGIAESVMDNYGVVSKEAAEAMAAIARHQFGAEAGLAICASPGPEDFEGKAPGSVAIAVDLDGVVKSTEFNFRSKPSEVKRLAALSALNLLRRALLK